MVKEESLEEEIEELVNDSEESKEGEIIESDNEESLDNVIGDLNFGSGSGDLLQMPVEGVSSTLEDVARVVEGSGLTGFIPVRGAFDSEEKEKNTKQTKEPVYFSEQKYMEQEKLYDDFSTGGDFGNIKNVNVAELGRADDFSERAHKEALGEMKSFGEHNMKQEYTHTRAVNNTNIQDLGKEKKGVFDGPDVKLDYTF